MELLPCGHVAFAGASRMCAHLIEADDPEYVRLLTGHGLDSDLCCRDCDRAHEAGAPVELLVACEGCVARCTEDNWPGLIGWRGEPGITHRPEPFDATVVPI